MSERIVVGLNSSSLHSFADNQSFIQHVNKSVAAAVSRLSVVDQSKEDALPRFRADEVVLGHVLGRGSFAVVRELNEIKLIRNRKDEGSSRDNEHQQKPLGKGYWKRQKSFDDIDRASLHSIGKQSLGKVSWHGRETKFDASCSREYLARRVWSKKGGKFVVKQIEPKLLELNRNHYLRATIDLELEIKYLATLHHPHIISLVGIGRPSLSGSAGSFPILEHVAEKLPHRLNKWMHLDRATKGITGFVTCGKKRESALLSERLLVAYDIAETMDYLHGKNMMYRDMKPDNVGFDADGVVKVFDFGLVRELMPEDRTEDGLYLLTGMTGGIRYMAPEVGLNQPYNVKADVYSWTMVFCHILMLEPPFGSYTPNMFVDRVFQKGCRPIIDTKWSKKIHKILKFGWHRDLHQRPTFKDIKAELREQILAVDSNMGTILTDSDAISVATTMTD